MQINNLYIYKDVWNIIMWYEYQLNSSDFLDKCIFSKHCKKHKKIIIKYIIRRNLNYDIFFERFIEKDYHKIINYIAGIKYENERGQYIFKIEFSSTEDDTHYLSHHLTYDFYSKLCLVKL